MSVLDVPLSLTARQARSFLERELRFRRVLSVTVMQLYVRIEHEPMAGYEIEQEVERSCPILT